MSDSLSMHSGEQACLSAVDKLPFEAYINE